MKGEKMKSTYKVTILALLCVAFLAMPALATDEDGIGGVSPFPPAAEEEAPPTEGLTCLNFDDLAPGTALTTYGGVRFKNTHGGLTVKSAYPGPVFTSPNSVLPDSYSSSGNKSRATFSAPVSEASVTMGDYGADSDDLYLRAYDSSNNLVDSDFTSIPSTLNGGVDLLVSGSDIAYVEFYGRGVNNNSVYFDNLCFTQAQTCDYCLTGEAGYVWCFNIISSDSRAYYLEGTCDVGGGRLKDAHATYLFSSKGLTMTAYGGDSGAVFSWNTKNVGGGNFRGAGVSSTGYVSPLEVYLFDCGAAASVEAATGAEWDDIE
jgi:hypothetical protein